jgi:hypothetical protein
VRNADVTRVKRMPGVGDLLCGRPLAASVANVWSTTIRVSVLFSLAKTSVHTTIRFEADDAEVFFFTDQAMPRNLEMEFAEVRARVKAPPPPPFLSEMSKGTVLDLADRLLRLGEMLDKGQLSADEFAMAKSRLFAEPD